MVCAGTSAGWSALKRTKAVGSTTAAHPAAPGARGVYLIQNGVPVQTGLHVRQLPPGHPRRLGAGDEPAQRVHRRGQPGEEAREPDPRSSKTAPPSICHPALCPIVWARTSRGWLRLVVGSEMRSIRRNPGTWSPSGLNGRQDASALDAVRAARTPPRSRRSCTCTARWPATRPRGHGRLGLVTSARSSNRSGSPGASPRSWPASWRPGPTARSAPDVRPPRQGARHGTRDGTPPPPTR